MTLTDDIETLRLSGERGDTGAMRLLALRLIAGEGGATRQSEGLSLLADTAKTNGDAAASLAVMAAAGIGMAQNLRRALDHLAEGAALGSASAQGQLRALGVREGAQPDWRALASGIDEKQFGQPPAKQSLCDAPRIRTLRGFMSAPLCQWLIARATPKLRRARTYDDVTAEGQENALRTNSEATFSFFELDVIIVLAQVRISLATGALLAAMEEPTLLRYGPGERFHRHFDFLDPSTQGQKDDLARRGQRVATCLISLNADYEGGETEFPLLDIRYRGGAGDALLFANVDSSGAPDRRTLHAGMPPIKGEKWMFSQWIRSGAAPK